MVGYTLGTLIFLFSLITEVEGVPVWGSEMWIKWVLVSGFCFFIGYCYRKSKNKESGEIKLKNVLVISLAIILLSVSVFSMGALLFFGEGIAYGAMGYLIIAILGLTLLALFVGFVVLMYFVLKATSITCKDIHSVLTSLFKGTKKKNSN